MDNSDVKRATSIRITSVGSRRSSSNGSILTTYLDEIGRIPLLSATEERALFGRLARLRARRAELADRLCAQDAARTDEAVLLERRYAAVSHAMEETRRTIIRANLRLPVAIAKKYQGRGLSLGDMIQEGTLGLMRAVGKFDHRRGVRFAAYAVWWIQQAISLAIMKQSRTVRLPAYLQEWQRKVRKLRAESPTTITVGTLAEQIGLSEAQVERALGTSAETVSLDAPLTPNGRFTVAETMADANAPRPDVAVEDAELRDEVQSALTALDSRTARILRLRYGFEDGMNHSLQEVGDVLQLSRERIRQLEAAAFKRLRHPAKAARLREFLQPSV